MSFLSAIPLVGGIVNGLFGGGSGGSAPPPPPRPAAAPSNGGLGTGGIIGIVMGGVALVAVLFTTMGKKRR